MNFSSMQLYARMQQEIGQLEAVSKNEMARLEGCFSIALTYFEKIKERSASYVFRHETDEIHFFKNIKPLFRAALEYYTLLYQAVLFKPAEKDWLVAYWLQQLKRVDRFNNRHREFYQYYMSGCTYRDAFYFTRVGNAEKAGDGSFAKNKQPNSVHHIAAHILGYQQYRLHVEMELERLQATFYHTPSLPETHRPFLPALADTEVFSLRKRTIPVSGFKQYFVSLISIMFSYR